MFSDKKFEIGCTKIIGTSEEFNQLNLNYYNKLNIRSAYGVSFRGYSDTTNEFNSFATDQSTLEISIDGSYALRLSTTLAMSVGERYILLENKTPILDTFSNMPGWL